MHEFAIKRGEAQAHCLPSTKGEGWERGLAWYKSKGTQLTMDVCSDCVRRCLKGEHLRLRGTSGQDGKADKPANVALLMEMTTRSGL